VPPSPDLHRLRHRLLHTLGLASAVCLPLGACGAPEEDPDRPARTHADPSEPATDSLTDPDGEAAMVEAEALMQRMGTDLVRDPTIRLDVDGDELVVKHVHRVRVEGVAPNTLVSLIGGMRSESTCFDKWCFDLKWPMVLDEVHSDLDGVAEFRFLLPWATLAPLLENDDDAGLQAVVHTEVPRISDVQAARLRVPYTNETGLGVLHPDRDATELKSGTRFRVCVPIDDDGSCADVSAFDQWGALEVSAYGLDQSLPTWMGVAACENDQWHPVDCCYIVETWDTKLSGDAGPAALCTEPTVWTDWGAGRPFVSDDEARHAPVGRGSGWSGALSLSPPADAELRRAVVAGWLQVAQDEHASIASFSRFNLELLALGAPADLLARSTRALGDEVRHAQLGFTIASSFADAAYAPGPLAVAGALHRSDDAEAVLVAAILEGCINETVCAVQLQRMLPRIADPGLRSALTGVVDDELRHAELSWAFVRWLLEARPELLPAAELAFAGTASRPMPAEGPLDEAIAAHGLVPPAEGHRIAKDVMDTVVGPCAEALLERARGRVAQA